VSIDFRGYMSRVVFHLHKTSGRVVVYVVLVMRWSNIVVGFDIGALELKISSACVWCIRMHVVNLRFGRWGWLTTGRDFYSA